MSQAQRKPREKEPRPLKAYTPSRTYKKPSGPLRKLAAFARTCFPFIGDPPRSYYEHQQRRYRAWFFVILAVGLVIAVSRIFTSFE